jgi:predicted PurR-regulated permease PerM
MRNVIFLVVAISAVIVVVLYATRLNTVPKGINNMLKAEQGDTIKYMPQIPDHVRKVMENSNRVADSNMNSGIQSVDK